MWTRSIRPAVLSLGALALCACGGGESESATPDQASAPAQSVFGGNQPDAAATPSGAPTPGDAPPAAASSAWPASTVPFRDDSAGAALATYLDRLVAGDLPGAAEVCDPSVPGTTALEKQAAGALNATESGMSLSTLVGFLTEGLDEATHEETSMTDDRATYLVTVPGKPPREVIVIKTLDGWRVQPPKSGLPNA